MKRTLQVYLGDKATRVGTLYYDQDGRRESAAFEYAPTWLGSSDRFALEPALQLVQGPQFHAKRGSSSIFHGAIADTEPDGWARRVITRDHAKRRQSARAKRTAVDTTPLNAVDYLLAVDDYARLGALRYQDASGEFLGAQHTAPPVVQLKHLVAASHALERNTEEASDLAYLRGRATSLGGMRPKCTVVNDEGHLCIGKFPSVQDDRQVTRGEVMAMQLARMAGIDAAAARIVDSDSTPVALIERFDRRADGHRLMFISAATFLGAETDDGTEHTYTELVDILRVHGAAAQQDIEELWRRVAFSILINNVDDHLHNHGFLHVQGPMWRLAPAYDINPFPDRARELKTWISDQSGPAASLDALMEVIPYFNMRLEKAKEVLQQVESAVSSWRAVAQSLGMTSNDLDAFADAFEHPERSVARATLARK